VLAQAVCLRARVAVCSHSLLASCAESHGCVCTRARLASQPEFDGEWVAMDELSSLPAKCRVRPVVTDAQADAASTRPPTYLAGESDA
jgi:hypothetical protein